MVLRGHSILLSYLPHPKFEDIGQITGGIHRVTHTQLSHRIHGVCQFKGKSYCTTVAFLYFSWQFMTIIGLRQLY